MRTAHSHFSEEGNETNTGQGVRQPELSSAKGHLPAICLSCLFKLWDLWYMARLLWMSLNKVLWTLMAFKWIILIKIR